MNTIRCFVFVFAIASNSFTSAYDECNDPLLDRAHLTATTSLPNRGPKNARLNGGSAWTASSSDFGQYLIIDLGQIMNITAVETQGRAVQNEYVMEYVISYGTNGLDYVDYKEEDGNVKMFKGNIDGDTIKLNKFEVPIIAQWIRINPTRWRDRISLRIELYGCGYVSDILSFNGSSLLRYDLLREPIETDRHFIRFRFKTNNADGILMYSRGTQGDYIALQLKDNRMILNIDLGSDIMTSLSVGSLLDDNMWHDVLISRNRKNISFSVDRVLIRGRIKGEFHRLDLNRALYIGGVPNKQDGLVVNQNFTGCIENFYLNATSIIHDLKETGITGENLRYYKVNTLYSCPEPPIIPVTFLTHGSYARLKGYEGVSSLNASLTFRTYEDRGIILYHQFTSPGFVKLFLEDGRLKVDIQTKGSPLVTLDNFDEKFNDGKWHQVILTISKNNLILNVDGTPMRTRRILDMITGPVYMIGGMTGIESNRGFVGCMRMISIDGNYKLPTDWKEEEYCCKNEIVFDACQMMDRCNPNPCKHSGVCRQNSDEFFCDCANTGYTGAVCHTSLNPLSCEAYKNINSVSQRADIKIDVDGSGPLKPFPVVCEFYTDGRVRTILRHNNERITPVDGFQEPGSFEQDIIYDADMDQIEALLNRSTNCRQRISYECRLSKLFNSPVPQGDYFRPNSWWVSRNNQKMDYWGGALPGSRKCECGILGNCADPTKWCNCDADLDTILEDSGDITEKEYLPVKQLRFGDTGTPVDDKMGHYTLGPLICEGDDLFKNVVTFRIVDATINLPTFDIGHSGDIYFEFKTTIENAVIIHSKGPTDYIKISINSGNQIQFQYLAGSGPLTVSVQTSYKLADNRWHSVSVERNRKEARIVIDGAIKNEVREPPGPVRALHLTSDLVIGATTDYRDGYVGCIRALLLNGQLQDLRSYARQSLYGISEGCMGKCESNPCLNNGTCHERYDGYSCDCRWTAFKGPICADEIGVNMRPSSMIKYDFMGSWRSTISEKIRVGFTTTNPKGFLLGLFSNISGEYMTIMVSNSGHLRVVFDFGFERQEVIFPNKHFGLGQYHDVRVGRKDSGATLILQVDNYEPKEFPFNIKTSADAQFNNIQYMYIGRNESMTEGFAGCISRVEFDDIYPLKLLFQEDGPGNVRSLGTPLTEDFCGVEPITHPPDIVETRPPPQVDEEKVRAAYNETDTAILGSVLTVIVIGLVIMTVLIGRYMSRHKGEYLTQEDKGAEIALDPDSAVVHSATGHQVQKKKAVPYASVASELGWVCQYDALPTIAQSIFFIGAIFGGLIFGWIADQYGRIPALIGANLMGFLAGVATAFTVSFWQFTLCRFFVGFAFDNCFTMMYILVLEYVGPKWRTFVANMSIAIFFTFATCILPWIAYYLADWRMTCIVTSVPLVLAVGTPWLIPESARWLVSQGQIDRAIKILGKFERINGTKVPDDIYKRFRETCARICKEEEADKTYSVLDLFRTPRLRNITILFIVIWMAISLVFDGHVRNVDNLGLDVFVTFTIAAATELPADTFLTLVLDRWGRRWLACGSLVISGIFSIWASAVSNSIYTASLAILGRFWINISYNIGLQYAAEVLPTVVRAQGVALIHIMGYVASILAPFVVYLNVVSSFLPLLVLGTLGIMGGLLTLFLPETLNKDLPQTLQDGEDFGKDQKMWDVPCIGRKREDEETPPVAMFRSFSRCSARNSMRASLRGEPLRSSMLRRSSIKSRKSENSITEVERL